MKMNKPLPNADVLVYYHGPNVAIEPRNSAAKEFVGKELGKDALGGYGNATIVDESRTVPLVQAHRRWLQGRWRKDAD